MIVWMGRDNYRRARLGNVWKDEFNFFVDKQALCLCLIMIFVFGLFLFSCLIKLIKDKMPPTPTKKLKKHISVGQNFWKKSLQ